MTFLFGIVSIFASLQVLYWLGVRHEYLDTVKAKLSVAIAIMFLVSGTMHFTSAEGFVAMIPPFLPFPLALVYVSGAFEILGAIGLLIPRTRRFAAYGLAALLIAVFPANIYAALAATGAPGAIGGAWYGWVRLPLQAVYIGLVLWARLGSVGQSHAPARAIFGPAKSPR